MQFWNECGLGGVWLEGCGWLRVVGGCGVCVVGGNEMMVLYASFVHIVYALLGRADAGDNEAKLMTKLAPQWVRTSDPVIQHATAGLRRPPCVVGGVWVVIGV